MISDVIRWIEASEFLQEDDKRRIIYALKSTALAAVVRDRLLGQTIEHDGITFCINSAKVTPQYRLELDVTFTRPPGNPVTHQIIFTNPPLLPRQQTGNEQEDMRTAVGEMLEGFI